MPRPEPSVAHFPALAGLRGVAALWVFGHHWDYLTFGKDAGYHVLEVGYLGVDVFFMLSGFVMTHANERHFFRPSIVEYGRFIAERIVRLYPTNVVILFLFLLAILLVPSVAVDRTGEAFSTAGFLTSLVLLQSWFGVGLADWIVPAWSVSVEMAAYVALPLVLFGVRRLTTRTSALLTVAVALGAFVGILVLTGKHDPDVWLRGGFVRLACEFIAGAALYRAWRIGPPLAVAPAAIAAIGLLVGVLVIPWPQASFLALPATALILLCSAERRGILAHVLGSGPLLLLGRISYSLYLLQWPLLIFWRHFGGLALPLVANLAMMAATLAAAMVLHRLVEAPSHALARSIRMPGDEPVGGTPVEAGVAR